MTIVYVNQQGAVVRRDGGQLRVTFNKQTLLTIPMNDLEQLQVFGNVQINTQAVALLLRAEIDVVFLSMYGQYRGRLLALESRFAQRRHAQLRMVDDEARSLAVAQSIVVGKIKNQRVILQRRAAANPAIGRAVTGMMSMAEAAERVQSLDQLRGYEGKAAAFYFEALRTFFDPAWGFETRNYYPPRDPANALLSFLYAKLRYDVETKLQLVGLDSYLGVFHALGYDRPALALDLMEEFRPIIADVVALDLVGGQKLTPDDFERANTEAQPIRMTRNAMKTVTAAYEARMADQVFHKLANGQTDYRRVLELQARLFVQIVEGKAPHYEPVQIR